MKPVYLTDSTATKPEEAIADFSSRATAQGRLFARTFEHTDSRVDLERRAGRLMQLVK